MTNVLFALAFLLCGPGALAGADLSSESHRFFDAFFFSVQTLATIGYGRITPMGLPANFLVTFEALLGLTGLALVTGLLFARFSRPTARVTFSRMAVVNTHDEIPSLIFRIANERLNQIVEAQVTVVLSRNEVTAEGEKYRTFCDLKLERRRSPVFALTWTIVHPMDEESPLYGVSPEELLESEAELIVSLTGIDDTFSQTIHTRFSYTPQEILWDHGFADILNRTDEGLLMVDFDRLHDVVKLPHHLGQG